MKKLQCKDLPIFDILLFVYVRCKDMWGNNCFGDELDIKLHLFQGIPDKLFYAKMYKLIHGGYLDGCWCGCRGDYELTEKGLAFLKKNETGDEGCGTYLDFIGYELPYEPDQLINYIKHEKDINPPIQQNIQ